MGFRSGAHRTRANTKRQRPCPPEKGQAIEDALRHFGFAPAKGG